MSAPKVHAFLDDSVPGCRMFFCRGPGKCAQSDAATRKKHCPDCILPRDDETMGAIADRIARGDA